MDTRILCDVSYRRDDEFVPLKVSGLGETEEIVVTEDCRELVIEFWFEIPNENLKVLPEIVVEYKWHTYGTDGAEDPVLRGEAVGKRVADQEGRALFTFDLPQDSMILVTLEAEVQSFGFDTYRERGFLLDIHVKREYNEGYCEPSSLIKEVADEGS